MRARALVVGGGFAGFWAAVSAKRVGGDAVDVALLSRDRWMQIRPRLYEADPASLCVDLVPLLEAANVRFLAGEAVALDLRSNTVSLMTGGMLSFDRLVIATGSVMRRPPIQGVERAFAVDTLPEAREFDRRLAELCNKEQGPVIAIVGAGFTGLELTLEMRDRIARHGGEDVAERARIILLDHAEVVGRELGPGPRPEIEAALREARVDLRLGVRIHALSSDGLSLEDGEAVRADAVVLATGMRAAGFVAGVPGDFDELGRLLAEPDLRAALANQVFVAGDAASADIGDGHRTMQSCQQAGEMGKIAGENAAHDLLGQPTRAYRQPDYVTCLDLGRSGAVLTTGWERSIVATGTKAKEIKKLINRQAIYPPLGSESAALLRRSEPDPGGTSKLLDAAGRP